MITFGLVQAYSSTSITNNFNLVRRYVSDAKIAGCAAICFPEAFLTGYSLDNTADLSLERDAPILAQVSRLAQEQKIDLLIGFMEQKDNQYFLTQGIWRSDGTSDFYQKTHLGTREAEVFCPGNHLEVFSLSCGLHIGVQICVETHFPDITQTYSLQGAEIIFAPHASPLPSEKRRELWEKYIPARSYDNRVYMACCNLLASTGSGGGCMVTDPQGNIILSSFEQKQNLLFFHVEPELVTTYHNCNSDLNHRYYPGKRRPELYWSD